MLHSKALQLFQALDIPSRQSLFQLIQSRYTCPNSAIRAFWGYFLGKKYLSIQNTAKKKVFLHCFPNQPYDDAKLRRLASNALYFLEKNVRYFEKKETSIDSQIQKISFYRIHDLDIFANALFRNLQKDIQALPYRDEQYYLQKHLLAVEKFEWEGQDERLAGNNLQQLTQELNYFYIIATLKYACVGLSHQNLRQATYNIPLLQSILTQIETEKMPLAVLIYYHAFMALQQENESHHFQALKKILLEQSIKTILQDPKEVLLLAINHCIKRLNSGETDYIRETFELYLFGLEQHILVQTGSFLSRHTFKNIIALALRLQEFDWTKNFIQEAPKWLEKRYLASQVDYNTAKLHFTLQQFEQAMLLLQQVDFDDIFMNMDAKVMLLKMYYRTQQMDALEALLNSFDVFLHRKKILSYHRDNYQNMVRLLRKLVHTPSFDNKGKQQLQQLIEDTHPLTEKAWLLEQLI
ncbi:MAG: hypothetical protein ACRBFS_20580 [Aureispira sp.]